MGIRKLHRHIGLGAILSGLLLLSACTQIPADLEQALLGSAVSSTVAATERVEATATATTDIATPIDESAAIPTEAATPAETATVPPEDLPHAPTEGATEGTTEGPPDAPGFILPTPTPNVGLLQPVEGITDTTAVTATGALTDSVASTASEDAPLFAFPTATPRPLPTATEEMAPMARVLNSINVRSGPGTDYLVIAGLSADTRVEIVGRNAAADWWQVAYRDGATGWVSAPLVELEGDADRVALVTDIPTPPPTSTPAPPTATASAPATGAGTDDTPESAATSTPAPAAIPATGQAEFRVVNKRLWDVYENGGSLDGPSVTCGEKRQLVVTVLDAAGNRLNGVAVQAEYGAREVFITGAGKGDGNVEFVLGGGQDVRVIRDNDGSEAISEVATGLSTHPAGIDVDQLIQARYCSDAESCQRFIDAPGCYGHFSWTVTFQRNR